MDVLITLGQGGHGHRQAEKFFRKHGLVRHVALAVPSFTAAVLAAAQTDYVACIPRGVAEALSQSVPLKILELPVRGLSVGLTLIWHSRTQSDATLRHFRELIVATLKAIAKPKGRAKYAGGNLDRGPARSERRPTRLRNHLDLARNR
jgi:DNA-binding transcriptional LysR family regulator